MNRKIFVLFLTLLCVFHLNSQSASIRVGVLKGISCVPCAYLVENKAKLSIQNIQFQIFDSAQKSLPKLLRNELDITFLTPKDAAKVFDLGGGSVIVLGICQNGNSFLLTNEESYNGTENLKEKTIVASHNSVDTEIFKHIFKSEVDSIAFDFSIPQSDVAASLVSGEKNFALLSEPFASIAILHSPKIIRAENLQKKYSESEEGGVYPAMFLVARTDFVKENQDLARKFIDIYKNAVSWTVKNSSKSAILVEKHDFGLSFAAAKNSIPNSALVWRDAKNAKIDIEKLYSILKISLPSDEFYFK